MKGNLVIGQSGGPTAAINASLCGVIEGALSAGFPGKILGMNNGIEGLLKERFTDLSAVFSDESARNALIHTPSSYLGSCRYKLPKDDTAIYEKIFDIFRRWDIRTFVYIGGNDSMDTVYRLSEYAKKISYDIAIMGVPKTIDNDLAGTDHCPGYGSAAKFISVAVREMHRDTNVYELKSVLIVEIMGRNAGWLTAASALARDGDCSSPDFIYLPEVPFSMDAFLEDVRTKLGEKNVVVCAVSEGIRDKNGVYLCEGTASGAVDTFGHKYLSGAGKVLANAVRGTLGVKARAVELSVFQRCAAHLASAKDLSTARENGKAALTAALSGVTGKMMGIVREQDGTFRFEPTDISGVANAEKTVPTAWITESGNDVTEEFLRYARPLIEGESYPEYRNGVPVHIVRKEENIIR